MLKNIKLKLILLLILGLVYSFFAYIITIDKNNRIQIEYNQKIKDLTIHYNLTIDNFLSDAKIIADTIQNDKEIIKLFDEATNSSVEKQALLREEAYKKLQLVYLRSKQKGVHQFHLQFKDNTTFLRMHKPNKFDDDLTKIRYSYKLLNDTLKPVFGFEQGRSSHAFRYLYPIYNDKNIHIGAGEVALSSNYIQDKLSSVNKIHAHFIVDKKIFDVKTWETKHLTSKYIQSIENKNYMFVLDKHVNKNDLINTKKLVNILQDKILNNISLKKPFSLHGKINNKTQVMTFLPIKNIKDKKVVAYIVSYTNSTYIDNMIKDYKSILLLIFFVMLIIFYFIYKTILNKQQLQQKIKEKTVKLENLNNNLEEKVKVEVEKNRKKDDLLAKQAQSAALGEMMDAIAHQWKQPLSVIGMHVQSLSLGLEYGVVATEDDIKKVSDKVKFQTQHLIDTIDEFRSFFRQGQKRTNINVKQLIDETLLLMKDKIIEDKIDIYFNGDTDIELLCLPNELKHIFINLINNSSDAFVDNNISNRLIKFEIKDNENQIIINISDNAGGIPISYIDKVFISNFTTKDKGKGTGIGLYLSKQIIDKLNGKLEVCNKNIIDNGTKYKGAQFSLIIPKNI